MKRHLFIPVCLISTLVLLNCDGNNSDDSPAIEDIIGMEWQLRYISEDGLGVTAPATEDLYTITFTDSGYTANIVCNTCSGGFDLDNGTIELGQQLCTLVLCDPPLPVINFSTEIDRVLEIDLRGDELLFTYRKDGKNRTLHFSDASDTSPEKVIMADPENFERSDWAGGSYNISGDSLSGDILFLDIAYSGCNTHDFDMVIYDYFKESNPVQVDAILPNIDQLCDAAFQTSHEFDLTPLREAYGDHGTIIINFPEPFSGIPSVIYEF